MDSVVDDLDLLTKVPGISPLVGHHQTQMLFPITEMGPVGFSQGKRKSLAAAISRGEIIVQKTFELTVLTLPQTDAEAVEADKNWLDISHALNRTVEFSIKENLSLHPRHLWLSNYLVFRYACIYIG